MELAAHEAAFVVFRKLAAAKTWTAPAIQRRTLDTLAGPWTVAFEPKRGAPATATLRHADLRSAGRRRSGDQVLLGRSDLYAGDQDQQSLAQGRPEGRTDLGEVRELATVAVNGKVVGAAWHAPYRLDLTDAPEARHEHAVDPGDQPLAQPADRGQAARRQAGRLRPGLSLHGQVAATAVRPAGPRQPGRRRLPSLAPRTRRSIVNISRRQVVAGAGALAAAPTLAAAKPLAFPKGFLWAPQPPATRSRATMSTPTPGCWRTSGRPSTASARATR
ncbi:glycosylhydrolase-like jelly roll fold domain-containing protein [Caulobacter segnis]